MAERHNGAERLLERIGGVRVVDIHRHAAVVGRAHALEATGHGSGILQRFRDIGRGDAEHEADTERRHDVGNVEAPDKRVGERDFLAANGQHDIGSRHAVVDLHGMDSRRLVKAGRHHHVARLHTTAVKLGAPLVVDADDAAGRVIVREQQRLRLEVRLERVVVVEVVLRQVGERRHRETRIPRAAQIERMGADLHGDAITFRIAHARKQVL